MLSITTKQKIPIILLIIITILFTGCATRSITVPSDFLFIMDIKSVGDFEGCAANVNIRIDANGRGRYETYNTDCAIEYDLNHMVTYKRSQVLETGNFKLNNAQLEYFWNTINRNNFFGLIDDYRIEMGFSYAFIVVEADGQRHMVDNIGMEVPEIRAIVEATNAVMPEGVSLEYGEGYIP